MERSSEPGGAHCFDSRTPEETSRLAGALARAYREASVGEGLVVALQGELGAGKTVFVKGLAEGLGVDATAVASPTYVLAHEYPAKEGRVLHHVDFYRLKSAAELEALGFFEMEGPEAVLAIEWGDRFPHALPLERLDVTLECDPSDPERRTLSVRAHGPFAEVVLAGWQRAVAKRRTAGH